MTADLESLTFRRATAADAPVVAELARRTFLDAFAAQNRPEDVEMYVGRVYGPAQQAAEIADARIVTLLGEVAGEPAAYVQLRRGDTPACVDGREPVEIMRFYVDRPWHGRGVAQRMMDTALEQAGALGARTAWLAVWEHNPRALAFYAKRGFRIAGTNPFLLGTDLQNDHVMILPLDSPDPDPRTGG